MRGRSLALLAGLLGVGWPLQPRQDPATCGTHAEKATEQLFLHRQAVRLRPKSTLMAQITASPHATDIGEIAVLEDSGDLVARAGAFDLDQTTVTFVPAAQGSSGYSFQSGAASYDQAAASSGVALTGLGDDDARQISLRFPFPFYGQSYQQLFVNSDGNLTFGAPDTATSERSLGRMVVGAPRIAPLFRDLNPARTSTGVTVLIRPERAVVSWVAVPEYSSSGQGRLNTFQVRLFPSGRIEFAYSGIGSSEAVVGISPGGRLGTTSAVSFRDGASGVYTGTIAQRFSTSQEIDIYTAALKFYETHEDAYDYLVFFNNMGVPAAPGALAYEVTARSKHRTGYGDEERDTGQEFGSPRRLQSVMNMGPLSQYPADPDARVPGRGAVTGDTTMTLLGHEAGHLFLAFASVRDPADPSAKVMLQSDGAHWSFNFNSEASLLEGNRLRDNGDGTFSVAGTVEGYSLLDQYLMGLVPAEQVPATFVVLNSEFPSDYPPWYFAPPFRGSRRDIRVQELMQVEGRRAPGPTVAQRRFRFAFILIVPAGTTPADAELAKLETYRSRFPDYYARYTGNRAFAETTLRRSLQVSVSPAAGVLAGRMVTGTISIQTPAAQPLTISLQRPSGAVFAPVQSSVTIGAGATTASFQITGLAAGADELAAVPSDPAYETGYARIQVLPSPSDLRLAPVSGEDPAAGQAVFRVTDTNNLPYAGLSVEASASAGGTVSPAAATSNEDGLVSFAWTPGGAGPQHLTASVQGAAPFTLDGVVNAASFAAGIAPGSFASIFGSRMAAGAPATGLPPYPKSLAGVEVHLGGKPAGIHYASDKQINVLVPPELSPGTVSLAISAPVGSTSVTRMPVEAASPGIFILDPATNYGAVLRDQDVLEIYCTGLGTGFAATVSLGGQLLAPTYSGPFMGYPGLDLVQVRIPAGLAGEQTVWIEANGRRSNTVRVRL